MATKETEVEISDISKSEKPSVKSDPESPIKKKRKSARCELAGSSLATSKAKNPKLKRCRSCLAELNSPNLTFYLGHPEGAMEEDIALFQPSLQIDGGDSDEPLFNGLDFVKPAYRLTGFTVYDREGHVVPIDAGIIERNGEIFFSGYLKPVTDDAPTTDGAVPVCDGGPLVEWWTAGFDGGDRHLIGVSTAVADYYLTEPSEEYGNIFKDVARKVSISKVVIEYLIEAKQTMSVIEYEDLLSKAESKLPSDCSVADEIIKHANFILEQVYSYEAAGAEDEETFMMDSPCIQEIIDLSGTKRSNLRKMKGSGVARDKPAKKMEFSKATTTPLVRFVFENFFKDQLEENKDVSVRAREKRCRLCDSCQTPECGNCTACKDMKKFGGTGKSKQACEKRKCTSMITYEDNSASMSEDENDKENLQATHSRVRPPVVKNQAAKGRGKGSKIRIEWDGKPLARKGEKVFYGAVFIDGEKYSVGDGVLYTLEDKDTAYICRIEYLYQWDDGQPIAHLQWFVRGIDTLLSDAADEKEIFQKMCCDEGILCNVVGKVEINFWPLPDNWKDNGGKEKFTKPPVDESNPKSFWYRMRYNEEYSRFEHGLQSSENFDELESCTICASSFKEEEMEKSELRAVNRIGNDCDSAGRYKFMAMKYLLKTYSIGDAIFVSPSASVGKATGKEMDGRLEKQKAKVDEDKYPEFYRKTASVRGSNECTSKPFGIGIIEEIFSPEKKGNMNITLKIRKMYRPEDTCLKPSEAFAKDMNLVYWSDELVTIDHVKIMGKCVLRNDSSINESVEAWSKSGEHRFYFNMAYNKKGEFEELSSLAEKYGRSKGTKGKGGKCSTAINAVLATEEGGYPKISRPLRCLDVFAGCGGLSLGLHQAGIAKTHWAIEFYEPAAKAFKMNNPDCCVFTSDCNHLLKLALEGHVQNEKEKLPAKGDVELLCGGPPCQGFSGMNRWNSREYSAFKNSLIASYLSYCDYYRPRFFILENVRNFATFKKSAVLRLCIQGLLRMGYACTFGILQAGNFGVAQSRRRVILLAAAPGEQLPFYPEPQTVFSTSNPSVQVGDKFCKSNCLWTESAPYRTVTVRDSMSDLPEIKNGQMDLVMLYDNEPLSHFQRKIRSGADCLRDHICKRMSPLVEGRMSLIPTEPGSDWRDLPNIVVKLSDGTYTDKLKYNYEDKIRGKSSTGALRGVCICATGSAKPCDPNDRQANTLIPWCLPHTSARFNQWAGLYGRLDHSGYFHTTVTNPEPMGKQGRVLHPDQPRVVSVRECARSQGFPDSYLFFGTIPEKHRQVGNAVPPPMGFAVGMEIRKAVAKTEELADKM